MMQTSHALEFISYSRGKTVHASGTYHAHHPSATLINTSILDSLPLMRGRRDCRRDILLGVELDDHTVLR